MSLIQEVGSQVTAASEEFPVATILTAENHIATAGAAFVAIATEHPDILGAAAKLEAARKNLAEAYLQLRVAAGKLATYQLAIGLPQGITMVDGVEIQRPPKPKPPGLGWCVALGRGGIVRPGTYPCSVEQCPVVIRAHVVWDPETNRPLPRLGGMPLTCPGQRHGIGYPILGNIPRQY